MESKKKYTCEPCKYTAIYLSEFNKHLTSAKHKRDGKPMNYKCSDCDYTGINRWNLTMHQATTHYTLSQKKELKYYCEVCDCICFSALYFNTHLASPLHKSKVIIHNAEQGKPFDINVIETQIKSEKPTKKLSNSMIEENLKKYMKKLIDDLSEKILVEIKNNIK